MKNPLLMLIVLIACIIIVIVCILCTPIADSIFACKHTDVVTDAAVAASCTETGLTEGKHCEKCGEVLVAQEIVPITHNFSEWETMKEPDCFFEGEKTRVCSICGIVENEAIEPIEHKFVQNPDTKLFACETCDARILNGHLYAVIDISAQWFEAYKICENLGGHLATITSAKEQEIITDIMSTQMWSKWIGGIFSNSVEGWTWITGEKMTYTNWDIDDGDPYYPTSTYPYWFVCVTAIDNYEVWGDPIGTWEDWHHYSTGGFICEWELDIVEDEHYFTEWEVTTESTCFNAGEKYRICTHCGLKETEVVPQLEHDFVLNETTNISSCDKCSAAMYDGRIYKIFNVQLSWFDAYTYCDKLGGHLVTITSAEEQAFIESYMNSQSFNSYAWIGAYSDGNKWQWVTDETFEYTKWDYGEPNCTYNSEYFAHINYTSLGNWNDYGPYGDPTPGTDSNGLSYLICEWEAE